MTGSLNSGRPTDADLRRLYVDDERSAPSIARDLSCDPTTVRAWLLAAGVTLRERGHNNRFEPGQPSAFKGRKHTPEALAKIEAATRARGGVPYLRQGQHWLKGAAPEMNPRWLGGVTPERQAFYRTPEWKAACVAVYARADGYCERCAADSRPERHTADAFHLHHIVSFKVAELRADPRNLALLCQPCHRWVHSRANTGRVLICADAAEFEAKQPTLFDFLDAERNAA